MDSMKIYFVLFRFTLASLSSALIDYAVFILIYGLTSNLLAGQACARLVSMLYNYSVVKKMVFFSGEQVYQNLSQISRSRHFFRHNFVFPDQSPDSVLTVAGDRCQSHRGVVCLPSEFCYPA